ncbi:uncharacterized protein [Chelonus insularis]|uniref:uncharacterized protein n=1 Tax=Chelonus insularis TaxID=460826 RepID=UPI00158AF535|nr:uncharacterized protein LOC118068305 [Chelonus insularis]
MQVTTCVLFWVLCAVTQIDARPQELGTSEVTRANVAKEEVGEAWKNLTAKPEEVRSRYTTSSSDLRIHEFYNQFYPNPYPQKFISNNSFITSPRRSRLPNNWMDIQPSVNTLKNNSQTKYSISPTSQSIDQSRLLHRVKSNHSSNINFHTRLNSVQKTKVKNSFRTTTKPPATKKPQVVKKPSLPVIRGTVDLPKAKPVNLLKIKKVGKVNKTVSHKPSIKNTLNPTAHLKNWPNSPIESAEDLMNYQSYTSYQDEIEKEPVVSSKPRPEKPVSSNYVKVITQNLESGSFNSSTVHPNLLMQPNVQEIIKWLQIPSHTTLSSDKQKIVVPKPTTVVPDTFSYDFDSSFNPNKPLTVDDYESLNDFVLPDITSTDINHHYIPSMIYTTPESTTLISSPLTFVNEEIIDIANEKRPVFRPISEVSQNTVVHIINPLSKKPNVTINKGQESEKNNTNVPPNVHIMFVNRNDTKFPDNSDDIPTGSDCPIIQINSITKVNNTIQSKEGCTDLNIIINSQLLNTFDIGSNLDENGQDKFAENQGTVSTVISTNNDPTTSGNNPSTNINQNDGSDVTKDPASIETGISQENFFEYDGTVEEDVADSPESSGPSGMTSSSEQNLINDSAASESNNPSGASSDGIPISGGSGETVGQSSDGVASSSGSLPSLPGLPNLGNPLSNVGGSGGSGGSTAADETSIVPVTNEDDEDDDYDFSLSGIMDGIANIFTYLTVLNPVNYGMFSLAAAPFAALAAGVLGIAAIFFPWAFTRGFGFARTYDQVHMKYRPNIEQVVKQSIHHYQTFPEWKSRRKKCSRRSNTSNERDIKGLQQMDQSLRTVTTQLLNVSTSDESTTSEDKKMDDIESKLNLLIKNPDSYIKDTHSSRENSNKKTNEVPSSVTSTYRRPGNSKFSAFEMSHPGQAMAMTEEELERELLNSRISMNKNPTTPGGISTWILLNPPSTTSRPTDVKNHMSKPTEIKPTSTPIKSTPSTMKIETTLKADLKTTHATIYHSANNFKSTVSTLKMEKLTTVDSYTTPKLTESVENKFTTSVTMDPTTTTNNDINKGEAGTKTPKSTVSPIRTTLRSTYTTPKSTTVVSKTTTMKVIRPNQLNRPSKPVRKPTTKPDGIKSTVNATSKIEKVTFKPIQTISPTEPEKPMFISKIQASLKTETDHENSISTSTSSTVTNSKKENTGLNNTSSNTTQVIGKGKPVKTSVLKVQLRKPVDSPTTIEIEPIQVNAPVLTIEKVDDIKKESKINSHSFEFDNTKIDVKLDYNPKLTKVAETSTETSTSTITTTTKRPKHTKRKKNKNRRRKPSSTTTTTTLNPISTLDSLIFSDTENREVPMTGTEVTDTSIQESKIVSETNKPSNSTKNKKKQPTSNQFGTQIYNFFSREVMPSVGVMSLVGLGLGLASYFLYPFGGAIARRNYEVEPNYKYNMNEYGGNYGQSEEEVLSKVFQGMNTDSKYGGMKDYGKNYYRYQIVDGAYNDNSYTTRKNVPPGYLTSSVPVYKPHNTPSYYNAYHRNTDFKLYPDLSTTPNYYDRQTKTHLINSPINNDRQFVIGNIPPEYSYEINSKSEPKNNHHNENKNIKNESTGNNDNNNNQNIKLDITTPLTTTESVQSDFEKQIAQNLQFVKNPLNIPSTFPQTEAMALKANEAYEEIEITPTAVAVEHGPRSLKLERLEDNKDVKIRRKRDSVIQQIPTRREIQNEEHEEDLSNEILDIIDSAISTEFPMMFGSDDKYDLILDKKVTKKQNEIENEVINKTPHEKKPTLMDVITTPKTEEKNVDDEKKNVSGENEHSISPTTILFNSESNSTTPITTLSSSGTKDVNLLQLNDTLELGEKDFNVTKISITTPKPTQEKFNLFSFVKTLAEVKLRLGITLLKHASENFAKYLGNIQKKLNGE